MYKFYCIAFLVTFTLFLSCSNSMSSPDGIISGEVSDIDGNIYKTEKIGKQWWMTENLKVTRFSNGDSIRIISNNNEWSKLRSAGYCNYGDDTSNVAVFGRLYNWYAVNDNRNLAPEGWHVASDEDWQQLEMYFGMPHSQADSIGFRGSDEAAKLKESAFAVIPSGFREPDGDFAQIGTFAYWWSSTEFCTLNAWLRGMSINYGKISRNFDSKIQGFSVRCVKD